MHRGFGLCERADLWKADAGGSPVSPRLREPVGVPSELEAAAVALALLLRAPLIVRALIHQLRGRRARVGAHRRIPLGRERVGTWESGEEVAREGAREVWQGRQCGLQEEERGQSRVGTSVDQRGGALWLPLHARVHEGGEAAAIGLVHMDARLEQQLHTPLAPFAAAPACSHQRGGAGVIHLIHLRARLNERSRARLMAALARVSERSLPIGARLLERRA